MQTNLAKQALKRPAKYAKSDFLADLSHEIRTPIGAVIGLANILLTTELDDKQRQCVTVMHTAAEALLVMINRTLDIDRIGSRAINLQNAPFDMAVLLEQIVGIMSVKAQEKNIGLTLHYETGAFKRFVGDSGHIRQIVMNLVGNAIKFTEKGKVTISFATDKNDISISVADTGIGVAKDKLDIIFDRFVQSDSSIRRKYGGTGLGLSISKALAEDMGGTLAVTSVIGKGSTFVLRLRLPVGASDDERCCQENVIYLDIDANTKKPALVSQSNMQESCCGKL
jgi:signal transduction histidine kinase